MKRIAFVIYRKWAYEILKNILAFQKENGNFIVCVLITSPKAEFKTDELEGFTDIFIVEENDNIKIESILLENKIDLICYYGWSWLIKEPILSKYICLCLHPSPLPKYRGGSPIQNQIINGELKSAVSIFRMKEGIDDGDIYKQLPMSLSGTIDDIFIRMIDLGTIITKQFILDLVHNKVLLTQQKLLEKNPPFKRRTQKQSEILLNEISLLSYLKLYNMVRSLSDPYPNVFISLPNGKLLIKEIEKCKKVPVQKIILNEAPKIKINKIKEEKLALYLPLSDEYVLITKYKII